MKAIRLSIGILCATTTAIVVTATSTVGYQSAERPASSTAGPSLVVHEWGTFTSIAGLSGESFEWLPHQSSDDLPCFVRRSSMQPKSELRGTVRMETPVLYFYTPREMTNVSVRVRFRQGLVTEWFPNARVTPYDPYRSIPTGPDFEGAVEWNDLSITPHAAEHFPDEGGGSHYYTARQTDAAPVTTATSQEKFLFYRGVGRFQAPLSATVSTDGTTRVWSPERSAVGAVLLFENRGGRIAYRLLDSAQPQVTFDPLPPEKASALPLAELEQLLVSNGLYAREARAMVATWRDSWFEEGARVIYIVPRHLVDSILPLDVTPDPTEVVRVFVGRIELITPAVLEDVGAALQSGDRRELEKHARFLDVIGARLVPAASPSPRDALVRQNIQHWSGLLTAPQRSCPPR